jgi:formylglycine-generating enzyme required for sulfatase activity
MKIELIQEKTFTARAGAHAVHGLRRVSQWEGLSKLVDQAEHYLIVSDDDGAVVKGAAVLMDALRLATRADLFITVPETTLPTGQVMPSFQVGQYHCANKDGQVVIDAALAPMVNVSYRKANELCTAAGYKLITELQCLALAVNIARQDINWTGGKVGEGSLYQGIHKGSVNSAQPGTHESTDPLERRWHQLSNGERIYDFAGNVFTWVHDDVQGDADGLVSGTIAKDSPSLTCAPAPSREKGVGYIPSGPLSWSGRALIRGGFWYSDSNAGVFVLDRGWPGYAFDNVGFRCTK